MTSTLITHDFNDTMVSQRQTDGYINLTAMCKACGKLFGDYYRLSTTQTFLEALSLNMDCNISELLQMVKGGIPERQGTWGHPEIADHLSQWLSNSTSPKKKLKSKFNNLFNTNSVVFLKWKL